MQTQSDIQRLSFSRALVVLLGVLLVSLTLATLLLHAPVPESESALVLESVGHAILEWTSVGLGLMTALLALLYWWVFRRATLPALVGAVFGFAGLLDGVQGLVGGSLLGSSAQFGDESTRLVVRVFLASGYLLLACCGRQERSGEGRSLALVWTVDAAAILAGALVVALGLGFIPSPGDGSMRVLSYAPAALFLLTLMVGARHRRYLPRGVPPIAAALLGSLIPQLLAEVLAMGAAGGIADPHLLAAHGLKLLAALLPMGALALELGLRQRELLRASDDLERAHHRLERQNERLGRAQTALEVQKRRLDSALAAGGTGTFVWHMDAEEVVFDDYLGQMLHLTEDERQGMSRERFTANMPEDKQAEFQAEVERCLMGASQVGMNFAWSRESQTKHLRCSGRIERDAAGMPLRMVGTLSDVTREVQAEEAQREAERRVRRFLDALPLGVYVEDRLGRTYYANAEAKLLLAGGEDEQEEDVTIVSKLSAASTYPPSMDTIDGGQRAKLPLLRSRAGERSVEDVELDTPAGHRVVRMWGAPIYDELGERVEFAMAVTQDVTELRQLEAERVQGQKLEAIGQLAAGIAHEINTPTQYVSDNTHFLETAFKRLEPFLEASEQMVAAKKQDAVAETHFAALKKTARKAKLDFVRREVPKAITQSLEGLERVATIVRAMKEFSHPGGGGMSPTDLNRAVQTTVTVARNEWKYVADVEFDLADDLPNVPVLPDELNQVILNIVVNAAHAIGEKLGEGSAEKGTIRIATRRVDDHAEIRISDDGAGVPAAIQERVFDPFFTTKAVGKGTGQGLAIARKVMLDGHHGDLKLESVEGEGATFTLVLPLEQPDTAEGTGEEHTGEAAQ